MLVLRLAYLLALAVWIGGIVVLAAVVAPVTFDVLQAGQGEGGRALAGAVFAAVLDRFHYVLYAAGAIMLVTLALIALIGPRPIGFWFRVGTVAVLLVLALYSGYAVGPEAEAIRQQAAGLPGALPEDDARRARFDQLHAWSTTFMMINAVGALFLIYWEARD